MVDESRNGEGAVDEPSEARAEPHNDTATSGGAAAVGIDTDGAVRTDREAGPAPEEPLDVEALVATLETVTSERDSHLADLQRITAEFSNFRRQATKRQSDTVEHAASGLAAKLLPILDACDAALAQGATDVEPIHAALLETLRKEGLGVLDSPGEPFDPERYEAVIHEESDDGSEPTVSEIMRTGYVWNGRVLRPAMVKVRG